MLPAFPNWQSGQLLYFHLTMKMPRDAVPSYKEVREALRPLDAPVCPHLRLKDA